MSDFEDICKRALHSERLETLGMLAGGVAHDFNNILAGILGHISYLKSILPQRGEHVESLIAVEDGAKKASLITKQILNFSKLDASETLEKINLGQLLNGTCSLLRGAITPNFKLECETHNQSLYVLAVEGKLAQVIVNLVINARDAMSNGGLIKVELSEVTSSDDLEVAFGSSEMPCSEYLCIRVSDSGHGMSQETMQRMFEPYFSTKKGKGTGLGLATVVAIVRLFGGAIQVTSGVGQGTTVRVYLPCCGRAELEANDRVGDGDKLLAQGEERILVVDDDYAVRNVLALSLQHLGYAVELASSGQEALDKYYEGGPFDLVILDMLMPMLSGDEVYFRLKEQMQEQMEALKVLLISGYSSEEAIHKVLDNGGKGFIQKPFTMEELSRKVRECIDST